MLSRIFMTTFCLIFKVITPAHADVWHHAAAAMGQFEGGAKNGTINVYYGCAGFYSGVDFRLPGKHPGIAELRIDGAVIAKINMSYVPVAKDTWGKVGYGSDNSGASAKARTRKVIQAIADGRDMELVAADGIVGKVSLKGSSRISVCASQ